MAKLCKKRAVNSQVAPVKVWVAKLQKGRGYRLVWVDPFTSRQRSRTLRGFTRRDAEIEANRTSLEETEAFRSSDRISWAGWVKFDLETYPHSEASREILDGLYRRVTTCLEPERLIDLDVVAIARYRALRSSGFGSVAGVRETTVNKDLRTLKAALERAVVLEYLPSNVCDRMKTSTGRGGLYLREAPISVFAPTEYQFKRLISVCPHIALEAVLYIAWFAGLRSGEILALRWCDIDFSRRELNVVVCPNYTTKGRRGRSVPLEPALRAFLTSLRRRTAPESDSFVIASTTLRTDKLARVSNISNVVAELVRRAGFVRNGRAMFSLHNLRKSCITRWFIEGNVIDDVQRWAGHASITTTVKYYKAVKWPRGGSVNGCTDPA